MVQNWPWRTNKHREDLRAGECLQRTLTGVTAPAFGYKIQAIAAHVLLGLDYRIVSVKRSGHPDIISFKDGKEFRFEIEAEVVGSYKRSLTEEDFDSLIRGPRVAGYFALAVNSPWPYWVVVPASELVHRKRPVGNAVLEALSDIEYSAAWTDEYTRLLQGSCREIRRASFARLRQMALDGHRL